MPLLLLVLLVGVFTYMWFARRGRTLTRDCRWREDRTLGQNCYRCAACGATCEGEPRDCLKPPG
ncbi:MAG: hypothetical protein U1E48_03540 [Paracoccaceae bacterium]